jgi:hypothetical protein
MPDDLVPPQQRNLIDRISSFFKKQPIDTGGDEGIVDLLTTERLIVNWQADSIFGSKPDRMAKYRDYDVMDNDLVEISSALDLYADFICANAGDDVGAVFTIEVESGENTRVSDIVEAFDERTDIQDRVWFMARNLVKKGDSFYEIVASADWVEKLKFLAAEEMFINIDPRTRRKIPETPYIQRDLQQWNVIAEFAPWEIVHFKLGEEDYGVDFGLLAKLRRTFRVQRMLEDALVVTRVVRAGQKGVYKIDVTGFGELEAARFIQRVKLINKKARLFSKDGKIKTEQDPLSGIEDIYIPTRRNGGVTDFQIVGGERQLGSIDDVEHFHNKLFAATKVPKAYLGYERDVNSKATLEQQHIAFTRAVRRFRGALLDGLRKIYKVEFLMNGIDPNAFDWRIKFDPVGDADEETKWKIEQLKAQVMVSYANLGIAIPNEWIIRRLFLNLNPAEADELLELMAKEEEQRKKDAEAETEKQFDLQKRMAALQYQNQPQAPAPSVSEPPPAKELESLLKKIQSDEKLMKRVRMVERDIRSLRWGRDGSR